MRPHYSAQTRQTHLTQFFRAQKPIKPPARHTKRLTLHTKISAVMKAQYVRLVLFYI